MSNHELAQRVLSLIDLTSLGDDDQTSDVVALCDSASTRFGDVAAVVVWPRFVDTAVSRLGPSSIRIAAVANFPIGSTDAAASVAEARAIIDAGGTEVDVVFPWRALRDGQSSVGAALVQQVRDVMPDTATLKVILETGELQDPALIRAAALESIAGGANFLKTSTGKTTHSATPEAARQLFEITSEAGRRVGVKISGGIRTLEQAIDYLAIADHVLDPSQVSADTMRIGASSLLDIVLATLGEPLDPS